MSRARPRPRPLPASPRTPLYQARVRATNAEGDSGWSEPPGSGRTNMLTNNAPVFDPAMPEREIAENTAAGVNVGAPVTATDADAGDTLSYTLGGADVAAFDFVETTGQIRTKTNVSYDFEAKSSYTVTVTASDGTANRRRQRHHRHHRRGRAPQRAGDAHGLGSVRQHHQPVGQLGRPSQRRQARHRQLRRAVPSGQLREPGATARRMSRPRTTTITSLTANTLYQARVRATNAEGDSGWSSPARVRPDQRAGHIGARRAQRSWHHPGRRAGDAGLDGAGERRRDGHREVPLPGQRQRGLELGPGLDRRARWSGRGRQRGGRDDLHRVRSDQRHGVRLRAARGEQRRRGPGGERRGHARACAAAPRVRFPGRQFRAARGGRRADFRSRRISWACLPPAPAAPSCTTSNFGSL